MTDDARIDGKLDPEALAAAIKALWKPDGGFNTTYKYQAETAAVLALEAYLHALARRSIQEQPEAVAQAWQELIEKDDRTSPEEYPDMALISRDELADFMRAPPPIAGAGWKVEASGLAVATIQADDFSLIELTRREGGGFNLTIHAGDEESGRWDDLSIGLSTSRTAELVGYLAPVPDNTDARAAQVKALSWEHISSKIWDALAVGTGGLYRVRLENDTWTAFKYGDTFRADRETEAEAKAAAQADYASRILAAIIPGTDASGVIEQLREALTDLDRWSLVIESAVRRGDSDQNYQGVMAMVRSNRTRLAALDPVKAPKS